MVVNVIVESFENYSGAIWIRAKTIQISMDQHVGDQCLNCVTDCMHYVSYSVPAWVELEYSSHLAVFWRECSTRGSSTFSRQVHIYSAIFCNMAANTEGFFRGYFADSVEWIAEIQSYYSEILKKNTEEIYISSSIYSWIKIHHDSFFYNTKKKWSIWQISIQWYCIINKSTAIQWRG